MVDSPVQRDGLAAVVAKLLELGRSQPYDVVARGDGIGQPHDAGPEAVLPAQLVEDDELVGLQRSQEPVCCRRRKGGGARDLDQRQRIAMSRARAHAEVVGQLDDPALGIDEHSILVMRGAGPIGYPGGAEVVNMQPPATLIKRGVTALPCIGDGRQSGTSGSPSILNASPEAADGGGLALLRTGDRVRIDLNKGTVDVLVSQAELAERRAALKQHGGYHYPASQTPWQEIQRAMVDQLGSGMVLEPAVKYQRVAQTYVPRDNH